MTASFQIVTFRRFVKGYQGVINEFVRTNNSGALSLVQCCSVAGLGFKSTRGGPRDGSFAYYVSEPIVENDMKGIGPFILAGIEVQKLLKLPMTIKPLAGSPNDLGNAKLMGSISH